jgi:hypothetical protein
MFKAKAWLALITYLNDNGIKYEELSPEIKTGIEKVAEWEAIFAIDGGVLFLECKHNMTDVHIPLQTWTNGFLDCTEQKKPISKSNAALGNSGHPTVFLAGEYWVVKRDIALDLGYEILFQNGENISVNAGMEGHILLRGLNS